MSKLTRAQRRDLEGVLAGLKRARAYLDKPSTVIARLSDGYGPSTTLDFGRAGTKECLSPVNKEYGSDIVHIAVAIRDLARFLEEPTAAGQFD